MILETSHPQNNNSLFGKLLAIDLNTNKTSLVSKGHINQQGLLVDGNIIISTEHGPAGGDEINIHRNTINNSEIWKLWLALSILWHNIIKKL